MTNRHELSITRVIDAPVDAVWRAWTEHFAEWWCPRPWTTEIVALDIRAGGACSVVMRGPAPGEENAVDGIFLEVVAQRRIVMTNALTEGWHPAAPFMVGVFDFDTEGNGTRYTATARHWDEATRASHAAMGFDAGWNTATDQLEAVAIGLGQDARP